MNNISQNYIPLFDSLPDINKNRIIKNYIRELVKNMTNEEYEQFLYTLEWERRLLVNN
ncbi:MAG: hypothetical protein AABY22_19910 [Nanoarchaeota archaeon]